MANQVEFKIKIDDSGTFRKVTMDAEELGRAIRNVQDESEKAKRTVIKWAEVSQAFDVMQNAIGELQGVMQDLTSAYQVQLVAETQLTTIMRQRMNATDGEIQGIKDLCSAQQELGVIGDEVQLSGAQQMATFLNNKKSLDVLIPAMNNLVAQQNGLNATNQDAVSIGNMMGKAMQGQVEVLQRVGITFTEAQKQVLQFGTESERAAMLAQVITDNVGNMNQELAKTDAGKQKQLENTLGDIKEQMGQVMQKYSQIITVLAQVTIVIGGFAKLYTTIRSVIAAFGMVNMAARAYSATCVTLRSITLRMNALVQTCSATMRGAAVSATTLKLAMQGLMISTGVGIAVVALTEALSALMSSEGEAAQATAQLTEAQQRAKQAHEQTAQQMAAVRGEMEQSMAKLKGFKGSKEQERKLVQEMNSKYGEAMGYYGSVAQWYEALTANSKTYCQQMINEIQLRNLANRAAELRQQRQDLTHDPQGRAKRFSTRNERQKVRAEKGDLGSFMEGGNYYKYVAKQGTSQLAKVTRQAQALYDEEQALKRQMEQIASHATPAYKHTTGYSPTNTTATPTNTPAKATPTHADKPKEQAPQAGSMDWYEQQIRELQRQLSATADEDAARSLQATLEGKQRELGALKVRIGLEKPEPIEVRQTAKGIIEQLDERLRDNPLHVKADWELKADNMDQLGKLGSVDLSNFEGVRQTLTAIQGITAPTAQGLAAASTSCQALGAAMQQLGANSEAAKAGMVMAAIGQVVLSFAQALASASTNWITWLAFGISGVATMTSIIATLQGFATGGIVGGSQKTGDRLMVRVNSGEMILNAAQQARLFALANGAATYGASAQVPTDWAQGMALPRVSVQTDRLRSMGEAMDSPRHIDIGLRLRGRDLVAAIANETRSNSRRSNIRL